MTKTQTKYDFKDMVEWTVQANAETSHVISRDLPEYPNVTSVRSVYNGVRPSHEVLEELYKWAETFNPMVTKKIDELREL